MNQKHLQRFKELDEQLRQVGSTRYTKPGVNGVPFDYVDQYALTEWKVKAKSLLTQCCGQHSDHYNAFIEAEKIGGFPSSFARYGHLKAVFNAAKEDFEGGYLSSIRSLVQAEVFENELEQARELLRSGYQLAAAVVAGVVLETGLRELCDRRGVPHGKLDKMNADLAKEGVYNRLQQKRLTALADIRNSAAHGKVGEFGPEDVEAMMKDVEDFLAKYLSE